MGNPSDGFNGKTISLSIKNFWAEVTIFESARLSLIPHLFNDLTVFDSATLFLYSGGGWKLLPCFLFLVYVMIDIAILDSQRMPVRLLFVYWATGCFVVGQIGAEDAYWTT